MKNKIIINTNISQSLSSIQSNEAQSVYSPVVQSIPQEIFFQKRFQQLQRLQPAISYLPIKNIKDIPKGDTYYTWDAYLEMNTSIESSIGPQNRLFIDFDFNHKSFTPFKKAAERLLPEYYDNAIAPIDQEVIDEIHYYFHQSKLPSSYFDTRNGLLNRDDSTRFSAFLSCGALDVKYLYNQVKDYEKKNGSNKSTYWIIYELLWREFYYWHYQLHTKKYFSHNGIKAELDYSKYEMIEIEEFIKKHGSNPFVLASLRELKETGFQTNRARQIFASYLIHCTDYHWRQGASLFEQYLIDYDVYSNWGNWMYLAGVGVDPRGSRFFNIPKQMKNYDPELTYIRFWCPELKDTNDHEILKRCSQE